MKTRSQLLQEAKDSIEEFATENTLCSAECSNPATEWHNYKPYCFAHKLAVTQHLS